jgi:hypothetical protein
MSSPWARAPFATTAGNEALELGRPTFVVKPATPTSTHDADLVDDVVKAATKKSASMGRDRMLTSCWCATGSSDRRTTPAFRHASTISMCSNNRSRSPLPGFLPEAAVQKRVGQAHDPIVGIGERP